MKEEGGGLVQAGFQYFDLVDLHMAFTVFMLVFFPRELNNLLPIPVGQGDGRPIWVIKGEGDQEAGDGVGDRFSLAIPVVAPFSGSRFTLGIFREGDEVPIFNGSVLVHSLLVSILYRLGTTLGPN